MATTKDFEPYILPDVTGCPLPVARQALMLSITEFCRKGKAWQAECSAGTTSEGVSLYTIVPPAGAAVHCIESATLGGRTMSQDAYTSEACGTIKLIYPSNGQAVSVRATLEPLPTATTLPELLLEYLEGIASAAKYRLMIQPGKPWSSPELAEFHKGLFDESIGAAFAQQAHGRSVRSLEVKPVRFI